MREARQGSILTFPFLRHSATITFPQVSGPDGV